MPYCVQVRGAWVVGGTLLASALCSAVFWHDAAAVCVTALLGLVVAWYMWDLDSKINVSALDCSMGMLVTCWNVLCCSVLGCMGLHSPRVQRTAMISAWYLRA